MLKELIEAGKVTPVIDRLQSKEELPMQNLESVEMTLLFARDREASLRRAILLTPTSHSHRRIRRWLGRRLIRTGTWLEDRQPMQPAGAT